MRSAACLRIGAATRALHEASGSAGGPGDGRIVGLVHEVHGCTPSYGQVSSYPQGHRRLTFRRTLRVEREHVGPGGLVPARGVAAQRTLSGMSVGTERWTLISAA